MGDAIGAIFTKPDEPAFIEKSEKFMDAKRSSIKQRGGRPQANLVPFQQKYDEAKAAIDALLGGWSNDDRVEGEDV